MVKEILPICICSLDYNLSSITFVLMAKTSIFYYCVYFLNTSLRSL